MTPREPGAFLADRSGNSSMTVGPDAARHVPGGSGTIGFGIDPTRIPEEFYCGKVSPYPVE